MTSASAQPPVEGRWTVLLLTCREPKSDFRLPLAEELQKLGHDVTYVFLKRRPTVVRMAKPECARTFSLPAFLDYARREFRGRERLLVFNSTNLAFPGISRALRLLCGGLWCLDMHDDLLYDREGLSRCKGKLALKLLVGGSDLIVHAAPTLKELFPTSQPLGNASPVRRIDRPQPDWGRVLILASLDARFDFPFVSATAAANLELAFDIYGRVSQDDTAVAAALTRLTKERSNVAYRGPYVNEDLPDILGAYPATLAPYVVGSRLTHTIDPLRYYHCLNSGMEVLSTPIPKALDFGEAIHIVRTPAEVGPAVRRLASDASARRNIPERWRAETWDIKAARLIEIVEAERAGHVR
ncbi:glycosyltransferase family 1 protein [Aureimonas leprariae]|uniref:Glycosyltransferase family 1 protein n=1 Tax=Plantimonas leprariae TaxID=2615207 RepID=A0A7V7PMZ7_9HYPH|nr:glycosyltransferase family 1 protein [Aureimonas leprariae]KAB0678872.1 glycosyltransferase family 1 protein [Aureimonas leprariae]